MVRITGFNYLLDKGYSSAIKLDFTTFYLALAEHHIKIAYKFLLVCKHPRGICMLFFTWLNSNERYPFYIINPFDLIDIDGITFIINVS